MPQPLPQQGFHLMKKSEYLTWLQFVPCPSLALLVLGFRLPKNAELLDKNSLSRTSQIKALVERKGNDDNSDTSIIQRNFKRLS